MIKSLTGRVFAILLIATVVIQVLSFGGVLAVSAKGVRGELYHFLATDIAFVHRFLATLEAPQRPEWLPQLSRGWYGISVVESATLGPPTQHPELDALMASIQTALTGSGAAEQAVLQWSAQGPVIAVPLDAAQALQVQLPSRPPFSPPPLAVIVAYVAGVTLLVMLVAWWAVRYVTRPLKRFTQAADALAHDLDAPPLPESGTTEVRQASRAFNAMQAALQKNLRERTRILASISHDLKTPLTRLRLRLASLLGGSEKHAAEQDIDAMQALIQEGLDYARSEHVQEACVPIDLNAMVDTLIEHAEDLGHQVDRQGRMARPVVCAPRATQRALQNLLDNALKYGSEVAIELDQDDGRARIRILDRGPGIAPEELERVFEPFYRVESSRNRATGGTGLGLTIARNLLQGQGAALRLQPRAGGGLAVVVAFAAPMDVRAPH